MLLLACYLGFALRWRTLLSERADLPLRAVFSALMTGYLANLLFPLRPGDILRALLIDRQFGYGKLKALTSVGLERVSDLAVLCGLGLTSLIWVPAAFRAWLWEILAATLALVALAVVAVSAVLVVGRTGRPDARANLSSHVRHGVWHIRSALVALAGSSSGLGLRVLTVFALSVVAWACFTASMIFCVSAFSPGTVYGAGLVLTVVTNLGTAIPSSPAGLGVYHALAVMTLVTFGISAVDALAIAIVSHGLAVMIQGGLGVAALALGRAGGWRILRVVRDESVTDAGP